MIWDCLGQTDYICWLRMLVGHSSTCTFICLVTSVRALWGNHVLCECALAFYVLLLCLFLLVTCSCVRSVSMHFHGVSR